MDKLRRVGGALESHRRPSGRRALLPAEADLCNAIGLSEEEYWHFVDLTEAYNKERPQGYELVPAIENDIVSIIVTLVIGIALSAVGALLAPKPTTPNFNQKGAGPQLKTADIQGQKRFAPQTSFDSVQELATLGNIIPLIFTAKGVRVNSQLLWSQMLSQGTSQQLRALMLFGLGSTQGRPDYDGLAIGDLLLENYTSKKLAVYYRNNGGRIVEGVASGDRYSEGDADDLPHSDAFSLYWDETDKQEPFFCGTRTPSTQVQFGVYAPMPNGMRYKVPYELVLIQANSKTKDDLQRKKNKIAASFPRHAALISASGTTATYRLSDAKPSSKDYEPWGTEDVVSASERVRIDADEAITVGDQFLIGSALYICHSTPDAPWDFGTVKDATFELVDGEAGQVETAATDDRYRPYERLTIQRAAIGTVSNNRQCHATELGLKSVVWRQINGFANVNSQPSAATIANFEKKDGSIALGAMSLYITRLSFFELYARPLGTGADWVNISGGSLFCIKGQSPQPQYNYIRVLHEFGQYEFRLRPYPGNLVYRDWLYKPVYWLRKGERLSYQASGYTVVFSGQQLYLTLDAVSNTEWIKGEPPEPPVGEVEQVSSSQKGSLPTDKVWVASAEKYQPDPNNRQPIYYVRWTNNSGRPPYYWAFKYGSTGGSSKTFQLVNPPPTYTSGSVRYTAGTKKNNNTWAIIKSTLETQTQSPTSTTVVSASGGSGSGLTFTVKKYSNGAATWKIRNPGTGYINGESVYIPTAKATVTVKTDAGEFVESSLNPYDAIADYVQYDAERSSHMDGPEHTIAYVNEMIEQAEPQYEELSYAGLRINSSTEWSNFSSLSAYFKKGLEVEKLVTSGTGATNLLPEIAYALLTDDKIGAGKTIGAAQVDKDRMTLAAKFCQANGFTWDGVITERQALRQWIFEQAGYCLLDFTILGGRFSLVPSVPYKSDFTIDYAGKPEIKALFTDGNIRNLKVSFLSPEERQLFRATCLWRYDKENGFPETRMVSVQFSQAQGGSANDPEETFDMSGFCTTEEHALTFAKYALKVRKEVDHGLTFETTPQAAMNLAPGEYFRLVSEATHTSRFNNGSIGPDGTIQSKDVLNGSYSILYWAPGSTGVKTGTLTAVKGKTTQSALFGVVFTISNTTTTNRVYKVETLSYAEDGLVEVAASHAPLTSAGGLAILDWGDDDFVTEVG